MASIGGNFSYLSPEVDILVGVRMIPFLKSKVEQWEKDSCKISVLVTGKTGTGKSTLINGIIGREVAKQGHSLEPGTKFVKPYTIKEGEIFIEVFDSPGLQDGTENEAQYLADMKKKCSDVDLVVYCIKMSEDRVLADGPDVTAMKKLNEAFGHDIWKNTIFALTFANDIVNDAKTECSDVEDQRKYFAENLDEWIELLHKILTDTVGVPKAIVDNVAIVPAGHKNKPKLPDASSPGGESYWLSRVWLKSLGKTKPKAQLALVKLNFYRIHTKSEQYKAEDQMKVISQHQLIFEEKGSEIGEALGIPAGKVIGEVAGLLAGLESFVESTVLHLMLGHGVLNQHDLNVIIKSKDKTRID